MLTMLAFILLAIGGVMIFFGIFGPQKYWWNIDEGSLPLFIFGAIFCLGWIGCGIGSLCLLTEIQMESQYDAKIAIVEEANEELEQQICSSVEMCLKHEENVYESLNIQTAIGLFSAYPNLKSNELVKIQIETYQANAEEIKSLKLQKTELARAKYMVYFGH